MIAGQNDNYMVRDETSRLDETERLLHDWPL
jgi:hypothetical protein